MCDSSQEEEQKNKGSGDKRTLHSLSTVKREKTSSGEVSRWPLIQINLRSESYHINLSDEP